MVFTSFSFLFSSSFYFKRTLFCNFSNPNLGPWFLCGIFIRSWATICSKDKSTFSNLPSVIFLDGNTFQHSKIKVRTALKYCDINFCDATTDMSLKWHPRNKCRNTILMTCHYPDLGHASDWSCWVVNFLQPIRNTIGIWVLMGHQYGISAFTFRCHCVGKPVIPLQNVSCFPSLYFWTHLYMYDIHSTANGISTSCWMPFNPSTMPCLSFQLLSSTELASKEL